jgi:hypothetical protein
LTYAFHQNTNMSASKEWGHLKCIKQARQTLHMSEVKSFIKSCRNKRSNGCVNQEEFIDSEEIAPNPSASINTSMYNKTATKKRRTNKNYECSQTSSQATTLESSSQLSFSDHN